MVSSRVKHVIASLLADRSEHAALPFRLCTASVRELPVTGAGVALITEAGHQGAIAATDGLATEMENLQFTLGEGPGIAASHDGRPVLRPDLAHADGDRWAGFTREALAAGAAGVFAFPLQVGGIRLGALNLYRDTPLELDDDQLSAALAFADAATAILLRLENQTTADENSTPELFEAMSDPSEVHQATGMISVQAATGLTEASLLLRAHAYSTERPLVAIARDVVARRLRFNPEDDHHE